MSKSNNMVFWKKNFPLCSFSISKCLPTIATAAHSPRHSLSDDDEVDEHRYFQTTNTSSSFHNSSLSSPSLITKNFNSLYTASSSSSSAATAATAAGDNDDDDYDFVFSPPDLAAAFASRRFFFSTPGESNSIVDRSTTDEKRQVVSTRRRTKSVSFDGSVEVKKKYSSDPRVDFRRSMKEMIEARKNKNDNNNNDKSDLEYLHELLLCFLALNPKDTHKYVISAFTDIVVDLLSTSSENHGRRYREVKLRRKRNGFRRMSM